MEENNNYYQGNMYQPQPVIITDESPKKHSGLGISSFIISIITAIIVFALIVMAGIMESRSPGGMDEEAPQTMVLGCFILAGLLMYLIGIGLAIGGLCQTSRNRLFAVLGLIFNILFSLGIFGLMVIGLAMG